MSKFNKTVNDKTEHTFEGAPAYKKDPAIDWLNFIFSSYLEKSFYTSAKENLQRFQELTSYMIDEYGPEFVAKVAVMSRNEFGLRSVSQFVAAMLNEHQWTGKREFYRNYCHRPDDVTEIFSILTDVVPQKRSHALIRGCGDYLSKLNEYQLDKYKMRNKQFSLYDVINLTHAKSDAIAKLKGGTLEKANTWEQTISASDDKSSDWKNLVESKTLGYLALIRNLRNILTYVEEGNDWIDDVLCPQLMNEAAIKKSLVYPYQIYSAAKNMGIENYSVLTALDKAFRIACGNMEQLEGDSLIILDVSGSMQESISANSKISIVEVGACYAAALYISQKCDIIQFGTSAAKVDSLNKNNNIFAIIDNLAKNPGLGYGTDLTKAYRLVDKHYNRIFVISDMQTMTPSSNWWHPYSNANAISNFTELCQKFGPMICFSFDLGNYAQTVESPKNSNVKFCTSLNDTVFKMIPFLENNKSLVDFVNQY